MGIKFNVDKNIDKVLDEVVKKKIKKMEESVKLCEPKITQRLLTLVDIKLHSFFDTAIAEFYAGYSPRFYKRRNNGSMKNIFKTEIKNTKLYFWFDPDLMPYRDEPIGYKNGLYHTVFKEGWHGGAQFNNSDALYPWRQPPIEYNSSYDESSSRRKPWSDIKKSKWEIAEKEAISPYERYISLKEDYEKNGYQKDAKIIITEEFEKVGLKIK